MYKSISPSSIMNDYYSPSRTCINHHAFPPNNSRGQMSLAVCLASRLSVGERVSAWQILEEDMNFVCVDTWLVMVTGG